MVNFGSSILFCCYALEWIYLLLTCFCIGYFSDVFAYFLTRIVQNGQASKMGAYHGSSGVGPQRQDDLF